MIQFGCCYVSREELDAVRFNRSWNVRLHSIPVPIPLLGRSQIPFLVPTSPAFSTNYTFLCTDTITDYCKEFNLVTDTSVNFSYYGL